jgi:UDP-2,3-diacylglucosamine pyrophosphatase LpxH
MSQHPHAHGHSSGHPHAGSVTKIKLVISDFHLSRGKWLPDGRRNPLEDFHQDQRFYEFLDHYSKGKYENADVELIVNGDFFDPLAVIPIPTKKTRLPYLEFPIEVEEPAAIKQFRTIIEGHPVSADALRLFLSRGKKIVFRWGNHDAAILWPGVQAYLREALNPPSPDLLSFQMKPYIFDRICVDHGHQLEVFNHFDEDHLFIERKSKDGKVTKILNLPFGSFFVQGFINRLKLRRNFINQVYPLHMYVRLTFFLEPWFFFRNGLSVAWFFIKMRFITHPMRFARFRKTLMLIGESFGRPDLEEEAETILCGADGIAGIGERVTEGITEMVGEIVGKSGPAKEKEVPFDTLIMGHNHKATQRIFPGGKQYINTGTWIPITSLDMGTLGHRMVRTYALIEYIDPDKPRASLKIWNGSHPISEDFA